jgi:FkbM family methyltransferase
VHGRAEGKCRGEICGVTDRRHLGNGGLSRQFVNAEILMTTALAFNCYKHSIRSAYHSLRLTSEVGDRDLGFFEYSNIQHLSRIELLKAGLSCIKSRLTKVNPALLRDFLDVPKFRTVCFHNREIHIPLLNRQAVEWYENSSIFNFDCIVETFHGMHNGARTIYDLGGHQGVWAAYYSLLCGDSGRVYTFEPSIINIESSALLFLINGIENVVNIAFGVGEQTAIIKKPETALLVDFVEHNIGLLRFDHIFWERADFIKIDIEGFEYEFLKSFPKLFEFCSNIHLELHIPHLASRGVDYREIYTLIPFDRVNVVNYQYGQMKEVSICDRLEGFCSLLITPRSAHISPSEA